MNFDDVFCFDKSTLGETDRSLVETVSRWANKEVIAARLEHAGDEAKLLTSALRRLLVDIGLQDLFPNDDASDFTEFTLASVLEQIGRADAGIAFLLANTFALQRSAPADAMPATGETLIASLVLPDYSDEKTTPDFDGLTCRVKALKKDDSYILSGDHVRPQCAGADASFFGVICVVEGEPACFLVPGDAKGLRRGESFHKTGLAASVNADLRFDNVVIPKGSLICRGRESVDKLLNDYRLGVAATGAGALLAVWEILKDWAETRVIKGKGMIFKDNPLVASMLGDIGGRIAICRLLLYDLARLSQPGAAVPHAFAGSQNSQWDAVAQPGGSRQAAPHAFRPGTSCVAQPPPAVYSAVSATCVGLTQRILRESVEITGKAMELMASAGYATEWNIERIWRDLKTLENSLGPTAARAAMARHYFGSNIRQG